MKKELVCSAFAVLFSTLSFAVEAQQKTRVPQIGWLGYAGLGTTIELFRRELRELGYVEGKNIAIEVRSADDTLDRLPVLADELTRLKVDVLVIPSTAGALAAKNTTRTIPIVLSVRVILLRQGWLTAWHGPGEISPGSLQLGRRWLGNDWSYSRIPFPISSASQYFGTHRIPPLRISGKKANYLHAIWGCSSIPWR